MPAATGYVERLDGAQHGDFHPFVAQGQVVVRHTGVFGSHDDAQRTGVIGLGVPVITFLGGCHNAEAAVFEVLQGGAGFVPAYRQGVKGSGRGFHGIGVDRYAATGGDDDGIYTGTPRTYGQWHRSCAHR